MYGHCVGIANWVVLTGDFMLVKVFGIVDTLYDLSSLQRLLISILGWRLHRRVSDRVLLGEVDRF